MTKPNDREQELASVIRSNLVEMAGKVNPHQIITEQTVRKAMGTSVDLPVPSNNSNGMKSIESVNSAEDINPIKEQPMEVN